MRHEYNVKCLQALHEDIIKSIISRHMSEGVWLTEWGCDNTTLGNFPHKKWDTGLFYRDGQQPFNFMFLL